MNTKYVAGIEAGTGLWCVKEGRADGPRRSERFAGADAQEQAERLADEMNAEGVNPHALDSDGVPKFRTVPAQAKPAAVKAGSAEVVAESNVGTLDADGVFHENEGAFRELAETAVDWVKEHPFPKRLAIVANHLYADGYETEEQRRAGAWALVTYRADDSALVVTEQWVGLFAPGTWDDVHRAAVRIVHAAWPDQHDYNEGVLCAVRELHAWGL